MIKTVSNILNTFQEWNGLTKEFGKDIRPFTVIYPLGEPIPGPLPLLLLVFADVRVEQLDYGKERTLGMINLLHESPTRVGDVTHGGDVRGATTGRCTYGLLVGFLLGRLKFRCPRAHGYHAGECLEGQRERFPVIKFI